VISSTPDLFASHAQVVVYAASTSKQTSAHILELAQEGRNPWTPAKYQHLSSVRLTDLLKGLLVATNRLQLQIPVSEDPHSAVFSLNKLAICASRAIYVVDPLK